MPTRFEQSIASRELTRLLNSQGISIESAGTLEALQPGSHVGVDAVDFKVAKELTQGGEIQIACARRHPLGEKMTLVLDDIRPCEVACCAARLAQLQELLEGFERTAIDNLARRADVLLQKEPLDELVQIRRKRACWLPRHELVHFSGGHSPSAASAAAAAPNPRFLRASCLIMDGSHGGSNTRST